MDELEFEWDAKKAARNKTKHGITFEEAASVFRDGMAMIMDDPDHSEDEQREIILGESEENRLLVVSFTERHREFELSALARPRSRSGRNMRKNQTVREKDDLRPEYNLDRRKAKPNRFGERLKQNCRMVVLDPDVAEVFTTPKKVNDVLRALITAMPRG